MNFQVKKDSVLKWLKHIEDQAQGGESDSFFTHATDQPGQNNMDEIDELAGLLNGPRRGGSQQSPESPD